MTMTESMLRAALAMARDALFVIDVESMEYIEFNDATCRLTGHSREELARIGPLGIWMQSGGSQQSLRQHYDALVEQSPTPMVVTTVAHRPDGSFVPVRMERLARRVEGRWVVVACASEIVDPAAPATDQDGQDTPGQTAPQQQPVQQDLETLRARVQASPNPASLIDYQALCYLDVNTAACELLGYTRAELLEGDLPLTGERTLDDLRALYATLVVQAPVPGIEETAYHRSDGTTVRSRVTRHAILADGMWVIYVDVKVLPPEGG